MGLGGKGSDYKKLRPELPHQFNRYTERTWKNQYLSRAERVICFLEDLTITSGILVGQKFKVYDWQRPIIEAWYATDEKGEPVVRTGLLSVARKNGKTGLAAGMALCHVVGPEAVPRGQIVVGACDSDQSGIVFDELEAYISENREFREQCNIKRFQKQIEHLPTMSKFKALSSVATKAHGLSPTVVILDELAQWGVGVGRRLYDALTTAGGARKNSLTLVIGTQSQDDHNLMSELIDDARMRDDPTLSAFIFEIPHDKDVFDEKNWPLANPAIGQFRSLEDMRAIARRAKRIPSTEATFRNLLCNQRVAPEEEWI